MRRFDAIPGLLQRKLGALGLAALLALPVPALVARLELIAAHATAVWFEVPPFAPKPFLGAPLGGCGASRRTPKDTMCAGCCTAAVDWGELANTDVSISFVIRAACATCGGVCVG